MTLQIKHFLAVAALLGFGLFFILSLKSTVVPLLIAAILAYLVLPIVKKLEKKHIPRIITLSLFIILFLILLISLIAFVVPPLVNQLVTFWNQLPETINNVSRKIENIASYLKLDITIQQFDRGQFLRNVTRNISAETWGKATEFMSGAFSNLRGIFSSVINIVTCLMFFAFFIWKYDALYHTVRSFVPLRQRDWFDGFIQRANKTLSAFIRGQLLIMLIQGTLYSILLSIIGLQYGVAIGILTGITVIIPYIGFTLGFGTAVIVAIATEGLSTVIGVLIIYGIVQTLDLYFITPKIIGDSVDLHPLLVFLALIIGGNIAGFLGILFAIPTAALIKLILTDIINYYKTSPIYT